MFTLETTENDEPIYKLIFNGNTMIGSEESLLLKGVDQAIIEEAVAVEQSAQSRNAVRKSIYKNVADSDSMLGTVADAAQMQTLGMLAELVSLDSASSFEEYKAARISALAGMSGGDASNLIASAKDFLAKVETGEILIPFLAKEGQASGVFEDVAVRATGVANVLIAASNA